MTAPTFSEMLSQVRDAIQKILCGAQSYSIRDRAFTKADLQTLYEMEKDLTVRVDRERRGGIRVRGITPV